MSEAETILETAKTISIQPGAFFPAGVQVGEGNSVFAFETDATSVWLSFLRLMRAHQQANTYMWSDYLLTYMYIFKFCSLCNISVYIVY